MEPEGFLRWLQGFATALYPEPVESSPHSNILFPKDPL
jgi:hypothetical protein